MRAGSRTRGQTRGLLVAGALYAALVATTATLAARDPEWNFDALGYVAAAFAATTDDPEALHRAAYAELEQAAPPEAFAAITSSSAYRRALRDSPDKLQAQVPFYANKPGYVAAVRAMHALGANAADATWLVSVGAYVALGLGVLAWLVGSGAGALHLLAAGALLAAPPFLLAARSSNPDLLAVLPLTAGSWLLHSEGRRTAAAGLGVSMLAVLVRPDTAILVALLAVWACLDRRLPALHGAAVIGAAAALVVGLVELVGGARWGAVFVHTFERRILSPAQMTRTPDAASYLQALRDGLWGENFLHPSVILVHLLFAGVLLAGLRQRADARIWQAGLTWSLLVWAYVPLHFLVFPNRADRFFLPTYVLSGVVGLVLLCHRSAAGRASHAGAVDGETRPSG